ncbi:LysM peptidoglycan-binding domain-containing protein [Thiospirochaeta perfilievii]|uniref:LysM peptidoglycan-binding domain-containing protein n=1 Tax=Thiospirochaeta perfilievii TaxID=252967 RepID=A0A5C1QBD1_9SPIO|nr:LysM peptidoglycan-binding domain-containing protein [Thiospirochaeta perfilievii]QEN05365.1 LysM peptidoglycan-binding domain-containing protein [Thiospirochaeta perfilievii]
MKLLLLLFTLPIALFPDSFFQYEVKRYDNVRDLAVRFKVQEDILVKDNKLENVPHLFVGQILKVPVTYKYSEPKLASLTRVMNNSTTNWSNPTFEIYKWDKVPTVLIFDTINYSLQSLFFKRLAFFIEKKDYIGNIYSLDELQGERGWNGHDYRAKDLARFFNKISDEGLDLTRGEDILLDILLKNRILSRSENRFIPLSGAIISCSRGSLYNHRKTILRHEAFHGLFFTSPEFREYTKGVWNSLSKDAKTIWILYLEFLNYETSDIELVYNEFMAYLLQISVDETYIYFNNVVFYRLYYEYPSKRVLINRFFSNNRTPYKESIEKFRAFTEKMLIE